jgi:hypothetical protein
MVSPSFEKSHDRFLNDEELPHFFKALADEKNETIRDYLLLRPTASGKVLSGAHAREDVGSGRLFYRFDGPQYTECPIICSLRFRESMIMVPIVAFAVGR